MLLQQSDILEFVRAYIEHHQGSPTIQEIANGLGYRSVSSVHKHLRALIDEGHLIKIPGRKFRALALVNRPTPLQVANLATASARTVAWLKGYPTFWQILAGRAGRRIVTELQSALKPFKEVA